MTEEEPLAAGSFSSWLDEMERAIRGEGESDVPCDGCTACCRSSQFVHIEPDEVETLARIPSALLFPAPRLPRGHVLLGYDENGHCPMLVDDRCSIYEHRPKTCRTYDCRIYAAAGVEVDETEKPGIARRARRWRFDYPSPADEAEHDAVRAAAAYVREQEDLHDGTPSSATERAVLAIRLRGEFLKGKD